LTGAVAARKAAGRGMTKTQKLVVFGITLGPNPNALSSR